MGRDHALSAVARGTAVFLWVVVFAHAQASPSALSGVVKDSLGNALSGAEVLVLADHVAVAPIVSVQTNTEGRYRIQQLAPGVYRVAALKQGYLAYLGQIDTLLRTSMDFVLRPAPGLVKDPGSAVPADSAWSLRIPERSLLRETEARDLLRTEGKGGPPATSAARFYETIQGQVEHLVALGGLPAGAEPGPSDVQGADTRMRISSSLGERGSVRVQGHRESLESADPGDAGGMTTGLDSSSVFLDVAYDTGNDASLAVKAYYGARDLSLSFQRADASNAVIREGQRAWGYNATWSKQIDTGSRLALQVGFLETEMGDGIVPEVGAGDTELVHQLSNRVAGAQGLFESIAGDGHHLRFGLRTERLDSPWKDAIASEGSSTGVVPGWELSGWVVRMNAEDAWSLSGPVSLVYGLGIDQSFDPSEPLFVAPHAGWMLSSDGLSLRMILSYRAASGADRPQGGIDSGVIASSTDPFGYEVQLEAPLPYGVRVKGSLTRTPGANPRLGTAQGLATFSSESLLPVLDGSAGLEHARIGLERQAANTTTSVQWITGTVDGVAAPLLPLQVPFRVDVEPSLRYWSGRIGVHVLPTGTDLAAEYVRVQESTVADGNSGASPLEQYVELRITQDLLRLPGWGGTCRLLVAARTTTGSEKESRESSGVDSTRTLAALNHRVSAGLSVAF